MAVAGGAGVIRLNSAFLAVLVLASVAFIGSGASEAVLIALGTSFILSHEESVLAGFAGVGIVTLGASVGAFFACQVFQPVVGVTVGTDNSWSTGSAVVSLACIAGLIILAGRAVIGTSLTLRFLVPPTWGAGSALLVVFAEIAVSTAGLADSSVDVELLLASCAFSGTLAGIAVGTALSADGILNEETTFAASAFLWATLLAVCILAGLAGLVILAGSAVFTAGSADSVLVPESSVTFSALVLTVALGAVVIALGADLVVTQIEASITSGTFSGGAGSAVVSLAGLAGLIVIAGLAGVTAGLAVSFIVPETSIAGDAFSVILADLAVWSAGLAGSVQVISI